MSMWGEESLLRSSEHSPRGGYTFVVGFICRYCFVVQGSGDGVSAHRCGVCVIFIVSVFVFLLVYISLITFIQLFVLSYNEYCTVMMFFYYLVVSIILFFLF
jgi:hypothetical protein